MARTVFRRRWLPSPKKRFSPSSISANFSMVGVSSTASVSTFTETISENFNLTGVVATSAVATISETVDKNFNLTGVAATAQFSSPAIGFTLIGVSATSQVGAISDTADEDFNLTGVSATSAVATFSELLSQNLNLIGVSATSQVGAISDTADEVFNLTGVEVTSDVGIVLTGFSLVGVEVITALSSPSLLISVNHGLTGVAVIASVGVVVGNHPVFDLIGVSTTTQMGTFAKRIDHTLLGVLAHSQVDADNFSAVRDVHLVGVSVTGEFSGFTREVHSIGVSVIGESGSFGLGGVPGDRTFIIGAIEQIPIATGIVLLPTSEAIAFGADPYVIGSSQYYTIGEVHWGSDLKTEGVDWEFVSPFKHIIHILIPPSISTAITLIYYRWNIGVRAGFKVNSYPVPFAFTGTTIVAERIPLPNKYFTVEYTSVRPGDNPRSMFAIFPNMVDDLLLNHDLYDGVNGFQTYRPVNYTVYDTTLNEVWKWNGSVWSSIGPYPIGTQFYAKRQKKVYQYDGIAANVVYTAGDGTSAIPQVLEYSPFGESISKNFLVDAFSINAAVDYPSAYEVAQSPGDYDPWLPGV